MRKFHINQFPSDRIWVLLKENFHNEIFGLIKSNYKFREFNKKYFNNKIDYSSYKTWKKRTSLYNIVDRYRFMPLWFIIGLSKIFKTPYSLSDFEKNIIAYRGPSFSTIVWNPKLPLVEDEKLMRILAHFLGDGHVGGGFGSKLPKGKTHSEYKNNSKELLLQFKEDLGIFGDMKISITKKGDCVIVSNVVGYILKKIYNIQFDCFNSRVPGDLFKLSPSLISEFIAAFFDDESHVYEDRVEVYSANKLLLLDIYNLIRQKFPSLRVSSRLNVNRRIGKNTKYSFAILSLSINEYRDLIYFYHPKKRKELDFNIKRRSMTKEFKLDKTKNEILKHLSNKPMSAKELSYLTYVAHSGILWHLNRLTRAGKIEAVNRGHFNENLWAVKS